MLTTKFRVWLQDPRIPPVWTGLKLVYAPHYINADCIEVTVEGNGHDLRRLIAKLQDIFAALSSGKIRYGETREPVQAR